MSCKNNMTWKESVTRSPGPESFKEGIILFLKGLMMGTADIIPGVSGGTIALITGIYKDLINAIKSVNTALIIKLLGLDFKGALALLHVRFLVPLFLGIGTAIMSLARITHHMLNAFPVPTWAFFFGLIAASIFVVGKKIETWTLPRLLSLGAGTVLGFVITGMIPVTTPEGLWFIFLSGVIAICAMILPGISGAFLLLIMGKYVYITGALKNPFVLENIMVISVFCMGCVFGLAGFSRILSLLLKKYYQGSVAVLTGLMIGSMQKIWPWKETLETRVVRGKIHVLREMNVLPVNCGGEFYLAVALCITGMAMVLLMDRWSRTQ